MKIFHAIWFAFTDSKARIKTVAYTICLLLLLAIPTALLSNPVIPYTRMIPATPLDYIFLFTTSILTAVYLVLPKDRNICKPDTAAFAGGFFGFAAVSCPICNKLFVLLLGFDFMFNIVNPIRPVLGAASVIILAYIINKKWTGGMTNGIND